MVIEESMRLYPPAHTTSRQPVVVPVAPPKRKIRAKDILVLNARRAGNRGRPTCAGRPQFLAEQPRRSDAKAATEPLELGPF
jgi:hypothetical protein